MKLALSISLMETCFAIYAVVYRPGTLADIYNRISEEHREQGVVYGFTLDETADPSDFDLDKEIWVRIRGLTP